MDQCARACTASPRSARRLLRYCPRATSHLVARRKERSVARVAGLAWPSTSSANSHHRILRDRSVSVPPLSSRSRRHHCRSLAGLSCGAGGGGGGAGQWRRARKLTERGELQRQRDTAELASGRAHHQRAALLLVDRGAGGVCADDQGPEPAGRGGGRRLWLAADHFRRLAGHPHLCRSLRVQSG